MLILIDADPIVYRCGFASETTSWKLIYEDEQGNVKEIQFDPDENAPAGTYMRDWLALNRGKVTILDKSRIVHPDPVSYALRATKVQIESIMEECEAHFKQPCKMLMWISGKGGSYRDRIATVRPYKGNRDPTHKPHHYDSIRGYLQEKYGSYVTRGIEADDAVSIFARNIYETGGESLVIATIDKDLDQIPGHHYNYMNKVFYAITQTEAERFFVYQLLAGDDTDNICGAWKCGDKAANAILATAGSGIFARTAPIRRTDHCGTARGINASREGISATGSAVREGIRLCEGASGSESDRAYSKHSDSTRELSVHCGESDSAQSRSISATDIRSDNCDAPLDGISPYKWWPTVVRCYADSQRKPGCPYAQANPETVAIEMAQLVKLQEYPGQLWHPHGDLVVPGFGEEDFDG